MAGIVNPKPFLAQLTGNPVLVKLKWGMEYKGACAGRALPYHRLYRPAHTVLQQPLNRPLTPRLSIEQAF